ncbi:MAG: succinate dehydrogenase cytochrome b subunit [Akkermansiaceae bacterium]|nr:succinate dehydrogenase cytochrome b subunit [Akkermansiaceae bacterium]NNM28197.1 succinate dehydrogenase cytochrome b subunit [Akkermansiaceae bacterium]
MNVLARTTTSFARSSIGKKIIVALTGIPLLLFLPGHLAGNLLVFVGPDAINEYGLWLHNLGHGAAVWVARAGLLAVFAIHVIVTIQLTRQNKAARPAYAHPGTIQASRSSRIMIWSGLTILAFVIYHILHFTARVGNDFGGAAYKTTVHGEPAHDVYKMMIDGFSWAPASIFYMIALTLLCSHLSHGFASVFQTLGLRSAKTEGLIKFLGWAYALVIWLGFLSIPVAIWIFGYGR